MFSHTNIHVLNATEGEEGAAAADPPLDPLVVAASLQRQCLVLEGLFMAEDATGKIRIDYARLGASAEFKEFVRAASQLVGVDLTPLSVDERKAFFINTYNVLTIHAITTLDASVVSVLSVPDFWTIHAYCIGGLLFSLDDMEHGILRGNRPSPSSKKVCFEPGDPRLRYIIDLDPRIHFALVCGAKSCPPVRVYVTANLERGLKSAAGNFCRQEIVIDEVKKKVTLSKIFMWYADDFGDSPAAVLLKLSSYLASPAQETLAQLAEDMTGGADVRIKYKDYDWALNK